MRIEIMLGMNPKISQSAMDAFDAEINRRVAALYPDAEVQVHQGSHTLLEMTAIELNEDRKRIGDLLQNVLEDDSWLG